MKWNAFGNTIRPCYWIVVKVGTGRSDAFLLANLNAKYYTFTEGKLMMIPVKWWQSKGYVKTERNNDMERISYKRDARHFHLKYIVLRNLSWLYVHTKLTKFKRQDCRYWMNNIFPLTWLGELGNYWFRYELPLFGAKPLSKLTLTHRK